MTDKPKQTRTPKDYSSIEKGAMKLPLGQRVDLVKMLKQSIDEEVKAIQEKAAEAKTMVTGI